MSAAGGESPWKLMTIRISRDNGRTYSDPIEVHADEYLPPVQSSEWPPCQCPKHRAARAQGVALPQMRRLYSDGS